MALRLLASWIAKSSSSTLKSLAYTKPNRFSSTSLRGLLLSDFLRDLMELRKWNREIEWIASLSLSCRSQIFSRIASISSISISHFMRESGRKLARKFPRVRRFGIWSLNWWAFLALLFALLVGLLFGLVGDTFCKWAFVPFLSRSVCVYFFFFFFVLPNFHFAITNNHNSSILIKKEI